MYSSIESYQLDSQYIIQKENPRDRYSYTMAYSLQGSLQLIVVQLRVNIVHYNEEDEWGADEEDDNDYSIDNLGQPSIDDQGSQDDIAKDFMASDYSSVIPYDREDPIVRMTASTQDDIAEARNHYEAMVRSTTVS